MRINFITFGSHGTYIDAVNRLVSQANNLNVFTEINGYTALDLEADNYFISNHADFIIKNRRGFGYWIWKPYLIKKNIDKMEDGDILLYSDSGCELGIENKEKLLECFDLVKKEKLMATRVTGQLEIKWSKKDLIEKICVDEVKYLNSFQNQATVILLMVCPETRYLINQWYGISCDYHYIDDSASISPNYDSFVEHRHDQSIFSLLTKKYNMLSNNMLLEDVVYIFRNRGGTSMLKRWIDNYGISAKKSMYTPF